jgi:hypothetical protein
MKHSLASFRIIDKPIGIYRHPALLFRFESEGISTFVIAHSEKRAREILSTARAHKGARFRLAEEPVLTFFSFPVCAIEKEEIRQAQDIHRR